MKIAVLTAAMVLVVACGQKGALYMPKEEQKQQPQPEQTKTKQSEQDKKDTEQ